MSEVTEIQQRVMARAVVEKTWNVAGYEGHGPVTMTLRVPDVTITDAEGRYIVVSPRQSGLIGSRLSDITDWLAVSDSEWVGTDPED